MTLSAQEVVGVYDWPCCCSHCMKARVAMLLKPGMYWRLAKRLGKAIQWTSKNWHCCEP